MRPRDLLAACISFALLFLLAATGLCQSDGKVTMDEWLKIIQKQAEKQSSIPQAMETRTRDEMQKSTPAALPEGEAMPVTLYWHMADDADVYLNGKPLRRYEPSFKTRPDEAPLPAFSATAAIREGDIFTVGGRRGGSFGFMLIAVDLSGNIAFMTEKQSWNVYDPGDRTDWYSPQVALASPGREVTIQQDPWYPQKELNSRHGNQALSIWGSPADRFAYLYGVVGSKSKTVGPAKDARPKLKAEPEDIRHEATLRQFYQISQNQLCLTRKRIKREVELKACTGDDYQLWSLTSLPGKDGSYYHLWDKPTGRCLEVKSGSAADGAAITVSSCSASAVNQQWRPQERINGIFRFKVAHSGKCLTFRQMPEATGGPLKNSLVQWACSGDETQSWKMEPFTEKKADNKEDEPER
jgi:hypothetical protein